jgi:threonine-phosphate decarboxylase
MAHIYDHGGNIFSVARQRGFSATESIDFSASINPLGLSENVKSAISTAIDSLIHYPDNSCGELKQTLAEIHGLTAEHFSIANGSTETIYNLPAMIRGKKALIVSPAFSEYAYALQQHHWEVRHFILSADNDFDLDLNQLEAALEEGYDALYICNPGNPSGKLFPRRRLQKSTGSAVNSAHSWFWMRPLSTSARNLPLPKRYSRENMASSSVP